MDARAFVDPRRELFTDVISRNRILNLDLTPILREEEVTINVWRNTGFEGFFPVLEKYLHFYRVKPIFKSSSFDSTFDLRTWTKADLDIIYVLVSKENIEFCDSLISTRIERLFDLGSKNVSVVFQIHPLAELFSLKIEKLIEDYPDVRFLSISEKINKPDIKYVDRRLEEIAGNWLTADAYVYFGKLLAIDLVMPSITQKIKVIATDLDNTLYNGVLGEDGYENLRQSEVQKDFVSWLFQQKNLGIMIVLVTRNEPEDVQELFVKRKDFSNFISLFDFIYASWEPKENMIQKMLEVTRISQETVLFIDDSYSEIEKVENTFNMINSVIFTDEFPTLNFIKSHPALKSTISKPSILIDRASDLKSSSARSSIFAENNDQDAFEKLKVELSFHLDTADLSRRSFELSNKTNQFNFALNRFRENDIEKFMFDRNKHVVLGELRDIYAYSGFVSLMCLDLTKSNEIVILEFCISCRALGRGLETEIFFGSLKKSLENQEFSEKFDIFLIYKEGERNTPVLNWLNERGWIVESGVVTIPVSEVLSWNSKIL
jgi:FkbH-like protein